MRTAILGSVIVALVAAPVARDHAEVMKQGFASRLLMEQAVSGHLTEISGRYKLRLSETVYSPGGWIGVHHHAGPGLRYVESGTLTYVEAGLTRTYKAGDCFYESGAIQHTARNNGNKPVRLLNFELLPVDWRGPSAYGVPDSITRH
jgi:quercetin dioxygenase-like cupin family protein